MGIRWVVQLSVKSKLCPILLSHCTTSSLMDYGNEMAYGFNTERPKRFRNWMKAVKITVRRVVK